MGQRQSTNGGENNEQNDFEGDEEIGPDILTIRKIEKPAEGVEQSGCSKKSTAIWILLTLLALLTVCITAPLVARSLKKGRGNEADDDFDPKSTHPAVDEQNKGDDDYKFYTAQGGTSGTVEFLPDELPELPFEDVRLPYFTEGVLRGYKNTTEFEDALAEAAKFLINKVVLQNLGYLKPSLAETTNNNGFTWRQSNEGEEPQEFYDLTDFESNNQEMGVDEADLMKADDKYVYAAYGNYVLVWNTNGKQVAQAKIPTSIGSEETSSQESFGTGIFSSSSFGTFSGHKAHVESLLLVEDHLVVIVSGYGSSQDKDSEEKTVLLNYLGTQIRIYKTSDIDTTGELTLMGTKDINGKLVDARSIGNQVHIATMSGIDTHTYLTAPLNRYVNFPGLTDEEYVGRVRSQALDEHIPAFVERLRNELLDTDHDGNMVLPNLLRVNRWQAPLGSANTNTRKARAMVDVGMFRTGLMNSITFITSLDVTSSSASASSELVTSASAFLAPSQQSHLYGNPSKLVLATRAWDWNSELKASEEVTHLVVLGVDNQGTNSNVASTTFESLGTVRGYVLNPYSLSIVNNEVRVATTVGRRWRFEEVVMLSSNTVDVSDHSSGQVTITDRSAGQDESRVVQESSTENYITVFDLGGGSKLEERGSVQLGEKDEVITAVRFFDDIAYCITFQQTDPFYVVDLQNINILGSFKQNGFSNYLHPLNDDYTLLLGIGQNATDEGVETGFMITVFDATDPASPSALVSYTVDGNSDGSNGAATRSAAQWDYKSFRYLDGKLIVPLDIVTYSNEGSTFDAVRQSVIGSFHGFVVFNVGADSISEYMRISHTTFGCHYCGYLAPRSFVYNGNVLTAQGNIVSSTSLTNKQELWAFHVSVIGEEARCCY